MTPEEKLAEIEEILAGYTASSRDFPHTTINKVLDVVQAPTTLEGN